MPSLAEVAEQTSVSEDEILQGVVDGGYCFYRSPGASSSAVHILASGSIMQQALLAECPRSPRNRFVFGASPVL